VYSGLREGYLIEETEDEVDDHEVFKNFTEAKGKAIENCRSDLYLAQLALRTTKALKKSDL
jgi:hypothetical protein